MHLKTLEITGFKSFGKKASLEFTAPISAIVGPNGSGKSNIAEAFRFVLGEQSIKSLRGKKGEDLIFNGGKALPRMNRGSVKVIFDNKKRILNIDFDEVNIERIVNRDGTNEYKINGSDVRLKDVVELLSSAHIGSSGHHIISQGEADRILNASISERKSILEEALGLKIYQYKKEEGERKLEKTEQNVKETESLVRELAPHLRYLKKQYEKIEKVESIRIELMEVARKYLRAETLYVDKKKSELAGNKRSVEDDLNRIKFRKEKFEENFSPARKDEHDVSLYEIELKKIISEKENKTRDIGKIEGEISYISRNVKKFEGDENQAKEIRIALKDVKELKDEIFNLSTFEEAKRLIEQFIQKFQTQKNVQEELISLREEMNHLENKRAGLLSDLSKFQNLENEIQNNIKSERSQREKEMQDSFEAERELMRIENEIHDKEELIKRIKVEEEAWEEVKAVLKNDLQEISMLLGRDVLSFENLPSENTDDRNIQHERKRIIERLKIRLEEAGITNAPEVLKEYKQTEERDAFLRKELNDLEISKKSLLSMIKELEEKIDIEFKSGIKKINKEFNDLFKLMFGGGVAELEVIKEPVRTKQTDDTELNEGQSASAEGFGETREGIDISVELPHKKTKGLVMLSGGERALTSIALIFAMSQVNPPPFIILDETDAALDEANSRKYGDMIEKLSSHSELILITHNRETMSRAGVIYGVTMASEGTSKLLSIKFDEAVVVAK